ncbi:MAG: PQQ-like beta-propeller repeat protein [Planctomycetes bacterium]|nr:PQQ-like beta-propeller repeat protein [Planctomycetota bacterium]
MKSSRTRTWNETFACACLVAAVILSAAGHAAEVKAAADDWPQFMGPNRDGIAAKSPKLLDAWPKEGPKLVWKSDELPFGPTCGVGTPIVAGGKVYTFAQIALPLDGIKPFNAEFLSHWGFAADLPDDLNKKIEAAIGDKKRAACKTKEDVEAYCKEFLATFDSAQTQKFGDAIRARIQLAGGGFGAGDLAWMGSLRDKEIKSRQDFMNLFVDRFHHNIYHGGQAGYIIQHADAVYKDQKWADSLICLDAASGKKLWSKELPGVKKSWGVEFGCSGVPAVVKDRLYFAGSGGVYCLDLSKKGELVWQGKGTASHTSPLVADGVVYACPGELAAFDAATGKELWRQAKVTHDSESPVLWKKNGKTYVLCSSSAPRYYFNLWCVDAGNGNVLWQAPSAGEHSSLTLLGDTLIMRGNGGVTAFHLTPQKPEQLWTSKVGGDYGGSPIIYQDHVYLCGQAYTPNLLTVLDLKTGEPTLKVTAKGGACSTGLVADGKIVFVSESGYKTGRLIMFKTTPDKYEEVGQLPNQDLVASTSPAFADGKVYVRMPTAIACYDLTAPAK